MRDNNPNYVMQPNYTGGDLRIWTSAEEDILCDLNYVLQGNAFPCNHWKPVGINESYTLTHLTNTTSPAIIMDVLGNDLYPFDNVNNLTIDASSVTLPFFPNGTPYIGNASVYIDPTTQKQSISFTVGNDFCGTAFIYYRPVDNTDPNNPLYGTYAMVTIKVNCEESPDNPCNLVCNGGMEGGIDLATFDMQCQPPIPGVVYQITSQASFLANESPFSEFYNWEKINSPWLFIRDNYCFGGIPYNIYTQYVPGVDTHNGAPNDRYIGLFSTNIQSVSQPQDTRDGIFTQLNRPLDMSKKYRLEFWVYTNYNPFQSGTICPGQIEVIASQEKPEHYRFGSPQTFTNAMTLYPLQDIPMDGQWHCIVVDDIQPTMSDLSYLTLRVAVPPSTPSLNYKQPFVLLDDVHLSEKSLTLSQSVSVPSNTLSPGSAVTFTLEVCNTSNTNYTNGGIIDLQLPSWLTYNPTGSTCAPPQINLVTSPINFNSCITFILNATVNNNPIDLSEGFCTTLKNSCMEAECTSPSCLYLGGDIEIAKTANLMNPNLGNLVTFTISAHNTGSGAVHNVQILDDMPACFLPFGALPTEYDPSTHVITFPLIDAGQTQSVNIVGMYVSGGCGNDGNCTNTASLVHVDEIDTNPTNDVSTVTLAGTIPINTLTFAAGTNLSGTITYTNQHCYVNGLLTITGTGNIIFDNCIVEMAPGSAISVSTKGELRLVNGTHLFACDEMWRGIELNRSAKLILVNAAIEDAECAVYIRSNMFSPPSPSQFVAVKSIFNNNYLGVFTEYDDVNDMYFQVNNCTIECTSPLKPYNTIIPGITLLGTLPYTWGYAGMVLTDFRYGLTLGNSVFQYLCNGIITGNSTFSSSRNKFFHIKMDWEPNYQLNSLTQGNINGTAVYLRPGNPKGTTNVTISGWGGDKTSPLSFYNCRHGVWADMAEVSVRNNHFDKVEIGAWAYATVIKADIRDNTLDKVKYCGVYILQGDNAKDITVRDNNFHILNPNNGLSFGGILLNNFGNANNTLIGPKNQIDIEKGYFGGIVAQGAKGISILRNKVHFGNPLPEGKGIVLLKSPDATISCNDITGNSYLDPYSEAIHVENSDNSLISCNTTDQCGIGFKFHALNDNSTFRGNVMGRHAWGLWLSPSAVIGVQDRQGNFWNGGDYWVMPAQNDNLPNYQGSKFHVIPFTVNPLMPTTNGNILFIPSGGGVDWFDNLVNNSSDYESCHVSGNTGECDGAMKPAGSGGISETEAKAANNEPITVDYQEPLIYEAQRNLYAKATTDNNLLAAEPIVADFYEETEESLIKDFYDLDQVRKEINENTPNTNSYQNAMQTILQNLRLLDSVILANMDTMLVDTIGYAEQRLILCTQIDALNSANYNVIETAKTAQIQTAETARVQANSLVTNEIYEANERTIQTIYYATIAKDIHVFTTTQKQVIEEIANQCPLAGGRAVYEARSLYAIYEPFVTFDNDALCTEANLNWRQAQPTKETDITPKFNIYPNPATNEVSLTLSELPKTNLALKIYNSWGALVYQGEWQENISSCKLNMQDYTNGLYFITLLDSGKIVHQVKLIISQ